MQKILDEDESFLHRQGKEKENKGWLKKAALFASQTLFSNPINNPAFEAHLQQFTNYTTSFFSLPAPFNQAPVPPCFVSKEEADKVIQAFSKIQIKGLSDIQELVSLTVLNDINVYCALIRVLLKEVRPQSNLPPNPFLLGGLSVVLVRRIKCEQDDPHLIGDSVQVFEALVDLLQSIHIDKNHQQVEAVLQTLSLLLDQMVYFNVRGLKRETVKRLHNALALVKGEKQPVLSWRVQYIEQALIRVPDNAAFLNAFKKRLPPVIGGLAYLSTFGLKAATGVISGGILGSLDLNNLWEAYQCFADASKEVTHIKYKAWYGALRLLDLLIETNQVQKIGELFPTENQTSESWIKQLAYEEFVLGLCDRLERLAYSAHQQTRDDALRLLKGFKEGKTLWEPHTNAQTYAVICLNRIARTWSLDLEQIEATGYFPSIWDDQFWQENISHALLNQVRDKAKVRQHMALMPADMAKARTVLTEAVSSGVEQLSVQIAHSHTQLQTGISELTGRLFPKSPKSNWLSQINEALAQHYQPALKIQRISGKALDLADCYINLAIVEGKEQQEADKAKLKAQAATFYRPSSYEEVKQANLQTPIPLEKLFDQRELRNGQEGAPKRILIQGRAGIGKTTLCKKLVHVYQQGRWQDRFDAVLWLPLRQLKTYKAYNVEELLKEKYFLQRTDREPLARQLSEHTQKILFVLDGLDEVAAELAQETKLGNFLNYLLTQPQVVVTSRPTGVDPTKLDAFDLELETIGFSQRNVQTYLHKVEPEFAPKIQALIKRTPVMQELANIPVQLDVLCYSWKEIEAKLEKQKTKTSEAQEAALTMTMLYQEMVDKLWRKDAERLDKKNNGEPWSVRSLKNARSEEIEQIMEQEVAYLSYLSFKGLEQNKIEFYFNDLNEIRKVLNQARAQRQELSLPSAVYEDLEKTSFLHTADASLDQDERAYHFLHLTFQEFFAAKFLAKHFEAYLTAEGIYQSPTEVNRKGLVLALTELQNFVAQHIYTPRYQIVWWMVAGLLEGNTLEGFFHLLEKKALRNLEKDTHIDLIMHSLHEARARLSHSTIARLEETLAKELELVAKSSKKDGKRIRLGQEPTFPEHLLLGLIEQHREYRDILCQALAQRQTLTSKAVALFDGALRDTDCDIEIILDWGLTDYAVSVDAIQTALLKRFEEEKKLDAIESLALELGWHTGDVDAFQVALLKRFEEEEEPRVMKVLAWGLGRHAGDVDAIQVAFLKRFEEEKEPGVIGALAEELEWYAGDVGAIQVALFKRFEEEKEPEVIEALTKGLGWYAGDVGAIQVALFKRFEEEKEPEIIGALANGLGWHACYVDTIRVPLFKRFEEEKEPEAIQMLALGLGQYAGDFDVIQVALLKRFEEEKEPEVIRALAEGLGWYAGDVDAIRVALIKRFEEEKESEVIGALAEGLGWRAGDVDAIRVALIKRFEEEKELGVIRVLALRLGRYAGDVDAFQVVLLKRFEEEKEPEVIGALAEGLGRHAGDIDAIQVALIKRFEEEKELKVIAVLVTGLALYAGDVGAIQVALLKRLEEEKDHKIIEALISIFNAMQVVFLKWLEEEKEPLVIKALTKKLNFFASDANGIRATFVKRLEKETEPFVIEVLAKVLGRDERHAEKIRVARLKELEGAQDSGFREEMAALLLEITDKKTALEDESSSRDESFESMEK